MRDFVFTGDTTVNVTASSSQPGFNSGSASFAVIDVELPPVTIFSLSDIAMSENGGSITVTLSRGGDISSAATVGLLSGDTSEALVPSTATFAANQRQTTFTILAVDDSVLDFDQNVAITVGGAGDDLLNGGGGNDTMIGGDGDDTYQVGSFSDIVTELAGEGYDRVLSSISLMLADNVEAGNLLGTVDLHMVGNDGNNWIVGNAGANTFSGLTGDDRLDGRAGDDDLTGGIGSDILEGGSGADIFRFANDDGSDTILDYNTTDDTLIFVGVSQAGVTAVQAGTSVRIDYDIDDRIILLNQNVADFDPAGTEFQFI
ncbi:MAG: calcium-binding protein [Pseudomonadota bacterium]